MDVHADGSSTTATAERVVAELLTGGASPWVRLCDDQRWTRHASHVLIEEQHRSPLAEGDVLVVSGGAKGVTARCLQELATTLPLRFVLLGRSPMQDEPAWAAGHTEDSELQRAFLEHTIATGGTPSPRDARAAVRAIRSTREIRGTLSALRTLGSGASYYATDVCDTNALVGVLDEVRQRWGRVDAIVHAAGVLADKHITAKTDEQFRHVFDTKIRGLQALWDATHQDTLKAVVLFSSIAASSGNVGQSDYAMANEVLERVATRWATDRPDTRFRAIGWGPWNGGMVTPELARNFQSRGVPLIGLAEGASAFVREFVGGPQYPAVVVGGHPGASGLMGSTATQTTRLAIRASTTLQPWLMDHEIQGRAVVPVAIALEWLLRCVGSVAESDAPLLVQDLRVLRGISLPSDGSDAWLDVTIEHTMDTGKPAYSCTLMCPEGRPAYRAVVVSGHSSAGPLYAPARLDSVVGEAIESPYARDVLFHGNAFQVLRKVQAVGPASALATVATTKTMAWGQGDWVADPGAIDGALQLALLWAEEALGGASLPMGIGAYRKYQDTTDADVTVVLAGAKTGDSTGRVSATLVDADERILAQLLDVDLVRRPDAQSKEHGTPE